MRTLISFLIVPVFLVASSPVLGGTIFEWMDYDQNTGTYVESTDKSLTIEFEDSVVAAGNEITGISGNILSIFFDWYSIGDGFVLDETDFQDPDDLIIQFDSTGTEIEFFQKVGYETAQALIWVGGFTSTYEGVIRFRGNLDSDPYNYAINGRRDNSDENGDATSWLYSEIPGRFVLSDSGGSPVPEPATVFLLGSGLMGLAGFGRKLRKGPN